MEIITLTRKSENIIDSQTQNIFIKFEDILSKLREINLPEEIIQNINQEIEKINLSTEKELAKNIETSQRNILRLLKQKL